QYRQPNTQHAVSHKQYSKTSCPKIAVLFPAFHFYLPFAFFSLQAKDKRKKASVFSFSVENSGRRKDFFHLPEFLYLYQYTEL
ncbi:MAG: hypothetical protein II487_02755, partial [Schwartzia sp.]|nr:hypothetical protein [Schwartzia sp. (in: firmicutes)]